MSGFNNGESREINFAEKNEKINFSETNIEKNEQVERMEGDTLKSNGEKTEGFGENKYEQKPLVAELKDDKEKIISAENNSLKPNNTFSKFGIEYKTDDKGRVYSIDGKLFPNQTYELNGHEYGTDDKGEIIKKGGSYQDVKKTSDGNESEVHHMPAKSVSKLEESDGPAIKVDKEDHRKTESYGASKDAKEYREIQKELIDQGKFREAMQMDIDDIHEKYGDKYDDAIAEMLDYVDQLEKEGKI